MTFFACFLAAFACCLACLRASAACLAAFFWALAAAFCALAKFFSVASAAWLAARRAPQPTHGLPSVSAAAMGRAPASPTVLGEGISCCWRGGLVSCAPQRRPGAPFAPP